MLPLNSLLFILAGKKLRKACLFPLLATFSKICSECIKNFSYILVYFKSEHSDHFSVLKSFQIIYWCSNCPGFLLSTIHSVEDNAVGVGDATVWERERSLAGLIFILSGRDGQ